MSAADVPELVEAGARKMCGGRTPTREALADARLALSVVPAPQRPIDPDDQEQVREAWQAAEDAALTNGYSWSTIGGTRIVVAVLRALRHHHVGLPARVEPSDVAVDAAAEVIADADGLTYDHLRAAVRAAYAVDGAK